MVEKYVGREARALVFPIYGASVPDASVPVFLAPQFVRLKGPPRRLRLLKREEKLNAPPSHPRSRRTLPDRNFGPGSGEQSRFRVVGCPPPKKTKTRKSWGKNRGGDRGLVFGLEISMRGVTPSQARSQAMVCVWMGRRMHPARSASLRCESFGGRRRSAADLCPPTWKDDTKG